MASRVLIEKRDIIDLSLEEALLFAFPQKQWHVIFRSLHAGIIFSVISHSMYRVGEQKIIVYLVSIVILLRLIDHALFHFFI